MELKISYVPHAGIDKQKWDSCIDNAPNGLIYACSSYLDTMSANWDALIMNDYEAVMPLTWNKKFGIYYLRQPAFTQQSGIFGNFLITENVTEIFLKKALERFPFAEINLNFANKYKSSIAKNCNLILYLNRPFNGIEKNFTNDLTKNIKKARRHGLVYSSSQKFEAAIELYRSNYSARLSTSKKDYENFLQLCILLDKKGQILTREVRSANNQLLATGLFLKDRKRIYNIMSATLPEGRGLGANHLLLYELVQEFSGQNLILDFEGSQIPSIRFFYEKFGPVEQPYPVVRINNLKFWQRLIKKWNDQYKSSKRKPR